MLIPLVGNSNSPHFGYNGKLANSRLNLNSKMVWHKKDIQLPEKYVRMAIHFEPITRRVEVMWEEEEK